MDRTKLAPTLDGLKNPLAQQKPAGNLAKVCPRAKDPTPNASKASGLFCKTQMEFILLPHNGLSNVWTQTKKAHGHRLTVSLESTSPAAGPHGTKPERTEGSIYEFRSMAVHRLTFGALVLSPFWVVTVQ